MRGLVERGEADEVLKWEGIGGGGGWRSVGAVGVVCIVAVVGSVCWY